MPTIHLEVQGMRCGGCVKSVTAALSPLPGVNNVSVDLSAGHVTVIGELPQGGDPLVLALTAAGYPAKLVAGAQSATTTPDAKKSGGCCG